MLIVFPAFAIGALKFGPRHIPTYLFTAVTAGIVAFFLAVREAIRKEYDIRQVVYFWISCLLGGLAMSRLFYFIFFYRAGFWRSFVLFFDPSKSGLSSFGGFFGAVLTGAIYYLVIRRKKKTNIWRLLDISSIGFMLGLAIGRVGCYSAGCCYGKLVQHNIPWAVDYLGGPRHPTQLYDLLNALFVFGVVQKLKHKKLFDGALVLINFGLYSFIRIIIEFFRVGPRIGWLTYNQIFYIIMLVTCSAMFVTKYRSHAQKRKRP